MDNYKMSHHKKVSVAMCTYNGAKYLREQIDSILSQTYPLYEIIVRDDCSDDDTWAILQEYQSKSSVLKCFQNDYNLGYGLNFKMAIQQCSGDYIAFSDQDDIWKPNKIEILVQIIGEEKMLAISNSKIEGDSNTEQENIFHTSNPNSLTIEKLIWDNTIFGHACMINALMHSYINKMQVETAHDYLIALIAYALNSVVITDKELQVWRRHSDAVLGLSISQEQAEKKKIKGINKTLYAICCLLVARKSTVIQQGYRKIQYVLSQLTAEEGVSKNINDLVLLTRCMGRQSLFSYWKASCICWKLKDEMFDNKGRSLRNRLLIFSFVYRWWYDHRFDMS
jgi:glycosyltransferase involved in cell wall biosynthesis